MQAKKNPDIFTIRFNTRIPVQARAAEYLNGFGNTKSRIIAEAVDLYLKEKGGEAQKAPRPAQADGAAQGPAPGKAETNRSLPDAEAEEAVTVGADAGGAFAGLTESDMDAIMESVLLMDGAAEDD